MTERRCKSPDGSHVRSRSQKLMRFNFPQTDQRPRRQGVQLQEVRQGASQEATPESQLLHPGRPAARVLQVETES